MFSAIAVIQVLGHFGRGRLRVISSLPTYSKAFRIKDKLFVEGKEVSAGSNPRMSSATDTGSMSRD